MNSNNRQIPIMATIMKEIDGERAVPVEYVKSLTISSFIKAVKMNTMKEIRKCTQKDAGSDDESELYGSLNIDSNLVKNINEIYSNDRSGYWIIKAETDNSYELRVYKFTVIPGYIYNTRTLEHVFNMYYETCPLKVSKIVGIPLTAGEKKYAKFTSELEDAVSEFRDRAENNSTESSGTIDVGAKISDDIGKLES